MRGIAPDQGWLGLALDAEPALEPAKNEGWSERLKASSVLDAPDRADAKLAELLKRAREAS